MENSANLPKCLLLPIDGSDESLRPIEFVSRLYPGAHDVNLILCYFMPPPPPALSGIYAESAGLVRKRREFLESRAKDTRRIFDRAKNLLLKAGFSEELIHEHIQQKEMTVARHACLLADTKKVDAILVQKRISSSLEGFLRGTSPSTLLQHCLSSPIWFTEGEVDAGSAAICIFNEDTSLRIADHAAFMLAGTRTDITLLHASRSVQRPVSCGRSDKPGELSRWAATPAGREIMPYLTKAADIVMDYGVEESRIQITVIPSKGDAASEILAWCRETGTAIIGLGHSQPEGIWSFLRTSVTRKILDEFRNMAVWVTQ